MIRVVATPIAGGQAFIIADGTGARGPGGRLLIGDPGCLQGSFDGISQVVAPVRAPAVTRYDRKNESGSIALTAEYEFATEAACFLWTLGLQKAVPRLANIVISVSGAGSKTLGNASIRPISFATIGEVSVRVSYPIQFGLIT